MEENTEFMNNLFRLAAWVDEKLRSVLKVERLTTAQYELLQFVAHRGDIDNGELLKRTCYDRSTLCRMVNRLRQANLVTVKRSNPKSDDRRRGIVITEQGERVVDRVQSALAECGAGLLHRLKAKPRRGLVLGLQQIEKAIGKTRFEGLPGGELWGLPRMYSVRESASTSPNAPIG
jgi:DNA-binding MarR family transcriptional regulator